MAVPDPRQPRQDARGARAPLDPVRLGRRRRGRGEDGEGPTVDPSRFTSEGAWTSAPADWHDDPEASLESEEALRIAREAIAELPERQRIVITLRDLEGLSSDEVRNVLDVTETNQRVLLHRARAKVRKALEEWIAA